MERRRSPRYAGLWIVMLLAAVVLSAAGCGRTVGETIDDATITARVKTALLNDPEVAGLRIDVDTAKGVVTMSGVVRSQNEVQRAIQIARNVGGVVDVRSTLQVNP
jgi:osmotically-inducible protein OsmY